MPDPLEVTVVLPCHDAARWPFIVKAVEQLRAQTRPPAGVVITVDHAPDLAARARAELEAVTVVENTTGERGASMNRNTGAAAVTTPVIAFLDDDQIPEPEWLAELVAPLADPTVVGTGGYSPPMWEGGRPVWFPQAFGWVIGTHDTTAPQGISPVRNVWSGNMAIRREAFEAIGGFRTGFGKVGDRSQPEDTDLCIRAAAASGGHWLYVPTAPAPHHVPTRRSTFEFYLRRCYNEGQGKVLMRDLNRTLEAESGGTTRVLDAESDYLKRTIPTVAGRELATAAKAAGRLAVLGLGLGAGYAGRLAGRAAARRGRRA